MTSAISLLARMDRLPFSRAHYVLLVIGGLGYTFDGADNALVAFLLPSMAREWGLDNGALGLLASASPVGYMVGALLSGTLGDRVGLEPGRRSPRYSCGYDLLHAAPTRRPSDTRATFGQGPGRRDLRLARPSIAREVRMTPTGPSDLRRAHAGAAGRTM